MSSEKILSRRTVIKVLGVAPLAIIAITAGCGTEELRDPHTTAPVEKPLATLIPKPTLPLLISLRPPVKSPTPSPSPKSR